MGYSNEGKMMKYYFILQKNYSKDPWHIKDNKVSEIFLVIFIIFCHKWNGFNFTFVDK